MKRSIEDLAEETARNTLRIKDPWLVVDIKAGNVSAWWTTRWLIAFDTAKLALEMREAELDPPSSDEDHLQCSAVSGVGDMRARRSAAMATRS